MATTHVITGHQSRLDETAPITKWGPNATWGMSIAAALLALLIGLSAVDIQRHNAVDAVSQQGSAQLDGRGKWGGYL